MRSRAPCILIVLASLAPLTGCIGGTHNPSYFPYLLPTGDAVRTHARPASPTYYANFDPHAVRLEVQPLSTAKSVKTAHLVIATVYDEKGQPRRDRRVEWMIEGVGQILEVDEAGIAPWRGYREGTSYAVSYTSVRPHRLKRSPDNPDADVEIRPGQTWCIISSPIPGETFLTVIAPGVAGWQDRLAIGTCRWVDPAQPAPAPDVAALEDGTALSLNVAGPASACLAQEFAYTLTVTNMGTEATQGWSLHAPLPAGLQFVRSLPAATVTPERVSWPVPPLGPGQSQQYQVSVRPLRIGPATLCAAAIGPEGARAEKCFTTDIQPCTPTRAAVELSIRKAPDPVPVGQRVRWQIEVVNTGTAPLDNVVLSATFSRELRPISADGPTRWTMTAQNVTFAETSALPRVTIYVIESEAVSPGRGSLQVEVRAPGLDERVTGQENVVVLAGPS